MTANSKFLILLFLTSFQFSYAQKAIGYIKIEGNDSIINLRVISEADAIAAGHGVFSITTKDGSVGAAELVPESDPLASEVRIQMPQGTKAWKEENYFSYTYGGTSDDKAYGLVQTSDNGFAICGSTRSFGAGSSDFMFLKLENNGEFDWGKAMGFSGREVGNALVKTDEDGYYLTGYAYSYPNSCFYAYVYHMDSSGDILFEGGYGTENGDEFAEDCIQTEDNNFVFIGKTDGFGAGGDDVYVKKIEYDNGDNIWGWAKGTAEDEEGHAIIQRSNGGYVFVGDRITGSDWDIYLGFLNSGGETDSSYSIGGDGDDYGRDVIETSDGGYVIAGHSTSAGAGGSDCYLRKLDFAGNTLNVHYYGGSGNDYCNALIQTSDNSLVMVGRTYSYGAGSDDLLIIKTDPMGNGMWAWVFGGLKSEDGLDILEGADGCLYVCGETTEGAVRENALLVKFAGDGSTCMGYQMGFSGSASPMTLDSSEFKAQKINNLIQTTAFDEVTRIYVESYPIKGDLIPFNPSNRDEVDITPTVTTICN